MNRRSFLIRTSFAVSAGLLSRPLLRAQPAPLVTTFHPLRRNVGYFTGRGGTIGWLSNKDALAAIDTQFTEPAEKFLADLPGREGRQLDVLVNTHHHGDHTGGNRVFRPATRRIVAHANVPELMHAAAVRAKQPTENIVAADTTFTGSWRMELGDEVISARYFGPAHTKGDIVTLFEKANVVHMGDLMFNRIYPVIDRPGGANIRGWIVLLEKVAAEYPADTQYIFGHSHATNPKFPVTGTKAELLVFRDYLSGLLEYVQKQIAAGKSREEVVSLENLPGFEDYHVQRNSRLPGNLGVAYDELTA
jgi:glyoxylase-like metal-dependent hydrolase (beta-lactamase superfamily II)